MTAHSKCKIWHSYESELSKTDRREPECLQQEEYKWFEEYKLFKETAVFLFIEIPQPTFKVVVIQCRFCRAAPREMAVIKGMRDWMQVHEKLGLEEDCPSLFEHTI